MNNLTMLHNTLNNIICQQFGLKNRQEYSGFIWPRSDLGQFYCKQKGGNTA